MKLVAASRWLAGLLLIGLALHLAFQPDLRDTLRLADREFVAGHYHAALEAYAALAPNLPSAELRLGMVRTLRGERDPAERALRGAMQQGLPPAEYHLALLYLGRALADDGRTDLALRTWRLLEDCRDAAACAYTAPGQTLAATTALYKGDTPTALAGYRTALATPMPPRWAVACRYYLALLLAPDDPEAALALLGGPAQPTSFDDALLAPLLPTIGAGPSQLAAVLSSEASQRPQLLGQLYVNLGLYNLAETQFARVAPNSPDALSAAAYAAYAQWRSNGSAAALSNLEALVAQHPDEPRSRMLLALAYLSTDNAPSARTEIEAVAKLRPGSADLEVAWANWYAAHHEYDQASLAYGRAMAAAKPAERGSYALLAARFHLATTFNLCEVGLPLAELAVNERPGDAAALTLLSAHRYHCGQFAGAFEAARQASEAGAGAEASYYMGAALAALGELTQARAELIRAADLAPASDWRRRAELALGLLR